MPGAYATTVYEKRNLPAYSHAVATGYHKLRATYEALRGYRT